MEALEALIESHANPTSLVNELNEGGVPPLFVAVDHSAAKPDVVRLLLETGAKIDFVKVHGPPRGFGALTHEAAKLVGIELPKVDFSDTWPYTESVIGKAVKRKLEIVKLFAEHGADFSYTDGGGYNSILDAVYTEHDPTEVVDYLLGIGISPDVQSRFGETPIVVAQRLGHFRAVARLVATNADESPAAWTSLIRAVVIGTAQDVERELVNSPNLEAKDATEHTAIQTALRRGEEAMVDALMSAGASVKKQSGDQTSCIHCAVEGGCCALVLRVLKAGCPVDEKNYLDETALATAAAAGNQEMVRLLLLQSANPTKGDPFKSLVSEAKDRETMLILLQAGADPSELDHPGRRRLVGLGEIDESPLDDLTLEQYMAARHVRQGASNPQDVTEPFKLAMIRAGCSAYGARRQFDDDPTFHSRFSRNKRPPPVWCFARFGQSFTLMPDGKTILIAGEHEDSYDPDFCIYNDVTLFHPDGRIKVFGYPHKVFEPTDFHTATLVGDFIWIIGGLGYPDQRKGPIPVYRLYTKTLAIERIVTTGAVPPRIYEHRVDPAEDSLILRGGKAITFPKRKEALDANTVTYKLCLKSRVWTQMSA